jgi:hypothetical protein
MSHGLVIDSKKVKAKLEKERNKENWKKIAKGYLNKIW